LPVEGIGLDVIQATKREPRIMRYELTDFEWAAIRSFLPNKPRGIPRVDDRRVRPMAGFNRSSGCFSRSFGVSVTEASHRGYGLREKTNLLNRINVICSVKSLLKKYSDFQKTQISCISTPVPSHRGALARSSRTRGGMRWTRQRQA
jgi:hypothetical protein